MIALRPLPGRLLEVLRFELALYRSLVRWVARRPDVPPGTTAIGYSRLVVPLLWMWVFGSTVEVVVVEVVLRHIDQPWAAALRVPLLLLGIWGVAWMLGMLASYRVRPHLLSDTDVKVRSGPRTWLTVPLDAIDSARRVEHELPGVIRTLHVDGPVALVGVSSRTNLELVLARPTTVLTSGGEVMVSRVGMWVDEPREAAALLVPRLSTRPSQRIARALPGIAADAGQTRA